MCSDTRPPALVVIIDSINVNAVDANQIYVFYQGPSLPDSIFGSFLSIPSTASSLSPLSYHEMSNLIPASAGGNGAQFGASSWVGDEDIFLNGLDHQVNFTRTFESELARSLLVISPIPLQQWTAAPESRGLNAIGNPGVSYPAINYELVYPPGVTTRPVNVDAGFKLLISQ